MNACNISPSYPRDTPVMFLLHEEIKERLEVAISALEIEAARIDEQISACGQLLDFLQPKEPGRIEIRWWISPRGPARGRAPYLVELCSNRREKGLGKWYQKKLPRKNAVRRVKERGEFSLTRDDVRFVMEMLTLLLDRREALLRQVGTFTTSVSRMTKANGDRLPAVETGLEGLLARYRPYIEEDERYPGRLRLNTEGLRGDALQGRSRQAAS